MNKLKRNLMLAAVTIAAAVALTATANASILPDPYATTAGTGTFQLTGPLGTSSCPLSGVTASAVGVVNGARGQVTGFNVSRCTGLITSVRYAGPITFSANTGAASIDFGVLKTTVLGGQCYYAGTLAGTVPWMGDTLTTSGTLALVARLAGTCEMSLRVSLTITLPGAQIWWP